MEQARTDARAKAQKIIADAEREGRALLEKGRTDSAGAAAAAMKAAGESAAKRREEILAQAAKDCEKLKADASKRMDKAAQIILRKAVSFPTQEFTVL